MIDAAETVADLTEALEASGVEYLVGGSMASILYGEPRSTRDVDVVIIVDAGTASLLTSALSKKFYVDAVAIARAIETGDCFNAIHSSRFFQVDVFTPSSSPWVEEQFRRRVRRRLAVADSRREVWLGSAEDTLLNKLLWFRLGNEASSVQWRDALGIAKIQKGRLDEVYLDKWSAKLDVADLLHRLRSEAL